VQVTSRCTQCEERGGSCFRTDWLGILSAFSKGGLFRQGARLGEGGSDQAIYVVTSGDSGRSWTAPKVLPGHHSGARWSPVLFQPSGSIPGSVPGSIPGSIPGTSQPPLVLFYTEGRTCWYCSTHQCLTAHQQRMHHPKMSPNARLGPAWRAGGDVMMTTTTNLKDWTPPIPVSAHVQLSVASLGGFHKVCGFFVRYISSHAIDHVPSSFVFYQFLGWTEYCMRVYPSGRCTLSSKTVLFRK
jgi:hypothetical protein